MMDTIEIKQRGKMVVPFIGFCILMILITAVGTFLSDTYKDDTWSKVFFVAGLILFVYMTYLPIKKLIKNQPIIVLAEDSIVLHTKDPLVIPKKDILEIDVTYVEDSGYFLNIKTENKTHNTNISWLDKTPNEMEDLIKRYRG